MGALAPFRGLPLPAVHTLALSGGTRRGRGGLFGRRPRSTRSIPRARGPGRVVRFHGGPGGRWSLDPAAAPSASISPAKTWVRGRGDGQRARDWDRGPQGETRALSGSVRLGRWVHPASAKVGDMGECVALVRLPGRRSGETIDPTASLPAQARARASRAHAAPLPPYLVRPAAGGSESGGGPRSRSGDFCKLPARACAAPSRLRWGSAAGARAAPVARTVAPGGKDCWALRGSGPRRAGAGCELASSCLRTTTRPTPVGGGRRPRTCECLCFSCCGVAREVPSQPARLQPFRPSELCPLSSAAVAGCPWEALAPCPTWLSRLFSPPTSRKSFSSAFALRRL